MNEKFWSFAALVTAVYYILIKWTPEPNADVADTKAAEAEAQRLNNLALKYFRDRLWHFVIFSLTPDDDNEFVHKEETEAWLKAAKNPTGVKVFVCEYRDIENHDESWEQYLTRRRAFKKSVREQRAADFKIAQNTEGSSLSYYRQHVQRKRAPQVATAFFAPVFLQAQPETSASSWLVMLGIVVFCVAADSVFSKKKGNRRQKQQQEAAENHIADANKALAKAGLKIEFNGGAVQLVAKEGAKR